MYDTTECPYCKHENDMTDALEGLDNDNTFDWECSNCGEEFEVLVEFEPSYSVSKIEYIECDLCHKPSRDIYEKGRVFPFPKKFEGMRLCDKCFYKRLSKEMKGDLL